VLDKGVLYDMLLTSKTNIKQHGGDEMKCIETRKVGDEFSIRTDSLAKLEILGQTIQDAMDNYCIEVVSFLMDDELALSIREKKVMIDAIRKDTKTISIYWDKTRFIARHGFEYGDDYSV
jgi:hypothetical protein